MCVLGCLGGRERAGEGEKVCVFVCMSAWSMLLLLDSFSLFLQICE